MNEDCLKLTSYLGERQRTGNAFVADALLDLYGRHKIATSVLLRGIEGFGAKRHPRTDRSLTLFRGPAAGRGRGRCQAPHRGDAQRGHPPH